MNPYLRPFLLSLLVPGCIGGDGKGDDTGSDTALTLDDVACFTVGLDEDCLEGEAASEAYVGWQYCEDPVRTVLAIGDLADEGIVSETSYGGTSPAETADTGNIRRSCCYEAATEVDPDVGCTPGRPFTSDGVAHLGEATRREDWCAALRPRTDRLSPTDRDRLARAWLADALAEHASIPAFGRLAVELAAHGAPPELLADCATAMADEVRHARACFALASAYAGRAYGPGPVAAPPRTVPDLKTLAIETFREGCVGESLAAGRAAVQLAQATDPAVRQVLAGIVEDETRHAELAWSILRWAIAVGGDDVLQAVQEAAERLDVPQAETTQALVAHGLPDPGQLRRVLRRMLRRVVEPSVRDLAA